MCSSTSLWLTWTTTATTAWRCTPLRGWCASCSAGPTCDCSPCHRCSWESTTSTCSLRKRTRCGRYCTLLSLGQVVGTTDFNMFPKEKTPPSSLGQIVGTTDFNMFPKEKTFPHPHPPSWYHTLSSLGWTVGTNVFNMVPKEEHPHPLFSSELRDLLCYLSTEPLWLQAFTFKQWIKRPALLLIYRTPVTGCAPYLQNPCDYKCLLLSSEWRDLAVLLVCRTPVTTSGTSPSGLPTSPASVCPSSWWWDPRKQVSSVDREGSRWQL